MNRGQIEYNIICLCLQDCLKEEVQVHFTMKILAINVQTNAHRLGGIRKLFEGGLQETFSYRRVFL